MGTSPDIKRSRGPFWRSIQGQLVFVLLVSLIPTLLIQAFVFNRWYETRRNDELQSNLQIARAVAKNFEEFVSNIVQQEYADGHALASFSLSPEEGKLWIENNKKIYPEFLNLLWASPEGTILISHLPQIESQTISDRKYFQEIVSGHDWSVSDLQHARATEEPVIAIARGIRDEKGNLLGVVVASIPSERLVKVLRIERPEGGGHAIVDSQGMLVFRFPWINPTWDERNWMRDYPDFKEALAGKEVAKTVFAPYEGRNRLVSFVPVSSIGWAASAGRTEEIALAAVVSQLIPQAAILFLITIAAFFTALLCSRFIVNSVMRLRDNALALGTGEAVETAVLSGPTEIRELSESFNDMAESLKSRETSLRNEREWLNVTISSIGDAVLATDTEGKITFLNSVAEKLTGWGSDEATGQSFQSIFRIINEKTRAPAGDIVERVLREGCIVGLANHTALLNREGLEVPIEDSAAPIKDQDGNILGMVVVFHDVTEKRRSLEALRRSEEQYRELVQNANSAIIRWRKDGTITFVNEYAQSFFGYSENEVIGKHVGILVPEKEATDVDLSMLVQDVLTHPEQHANNINENLRSDGSRAWMAWTNKPIFDERGEVAEILAVGTDITQLKQAEEARRTAEQEKSLILDNANEIIAFHDTGNNLVWANEAYLKATGLPLSELKGRKCYSCWGLDRPCNKCPVATAIKTGKPQEAELTPDNQAHWPAEQGCWNVRATPVRDSAGDLIGAIEIAHDITDRKRTEEALAAAHRQIQSIIDNTPALVYALDLKEHFVLANTALADLLNSTPEQMIGKRRHEFMPKEDADWHEANDREAIQAGGALEFEEYSKLEGRSITWLTTKFPLRDAQGRIFAVAGISNDISERKRAEAAIRQSEKKLRSIFRAAPVGIGLTINRVILEANEYLCKMTGYSREELLNAPGRMLYPSDEEYEWVGREKYRQISEKGTGTVETVWKRKDGSLIHIVLSSTPNDSKDPSSGITFIALDITARKKAEEALVESEERYRGVVQHTSAVIVRVDPQGIIRFANDRALEFFGYSVDELIGKHAVGTIVPEQETTGRDLAAMVEAIAQNPDSFHSNANENIRKNGERVWVEWTNSGVFNADGNLAEFLSVGIDATNRKRAEEAVRQSQMTFAELIERSPFGTYVVDSQFRIATMNASSQEGAFRNARPVVGRDLAEVMRILWPEEVATGIINLFRHTLETGDPYYSPCFINPRADVGITESYEWELHRIKLPDGQYSVVCYYYDSTKLRAAEAAVRESEEHMRLALDTPGLGHWVSDFVNQTLWCSPRLRSTFGLTPDEPVSYELFVKKLIAPEDGARVDEIFRRSIEAKTDYVAEYRAIRSDDGLHRWIHAKGRTIYDDSGRPLKMLGVALDLTEQKEIEEELYRSQAEFRLLSETAGELLVSQNPQAIVNELCLKVMNHLDCHVFFNFLVDESAGKLRLNACAGIPKQESEKIEWLDFGIAVNGCVASHGERIIAEDIVNTSDTRTELVKSYGIQAYACHPLRVGGNLIGTLSFGTKSRNHFSPQEISLMKTVADQVAVSMERVRLIEGLRTARDELELRVKERTAELERSNQALQDFASIASHDLQEPLRKVATFGNMLRQKTNDSFGQTENDYLNRMLDATTRMQGLLKSLLEYSRVTSQQEPFQEVDLYDIVHEVLSDLEVRIRKSGGEIKIGNLPTVAADPMQMRQLFQNLIANALKFHKEGDKPFVAVSCTVHDRTCRIVVEDNGIGFDQELADIIFAPFQRLHGRNSKYEGTGMGLAICKKIAERHGGDIAAKSTPGMGTSFIVQLPISSA